MIWSDIAGNLDAGTYNHPDGTIRYNKIGCFVKTIEELENGKIRP